MTTRPRAGAGPRARRWRRSVTSSTAPRASMADQHAALGVEVDQRRGLLGVDLEPVPDGLGLVVVAQVQLAAAAVADAGLGGRVELEVPDVPALLAGAPAGQPPHHLLVARRRVEHDVERGAEVGQDRVAARRPGRRCAGSRRAGSPAAASGWPSRSWTIALVTSSGTRSPASMYFLAVRPSSVPPETLARKMSPVEILGMPKCGGDELGLGSLARARRTDHHQSQGVPFVVAPSTGECRGERITGGTLRSCAA